MTLLLQIAAYVLASGLLGCVGWAIWEEVRDGKRRAIQRERDAIAAASRERERHLCAVIDLTERRKAMLSR